MIQINWKQIQKSSIWIYFLLGNLNIFWHNIMKFDDLFQNQDNYIQIDHDTLLSFPGKNKSFRTIDINKGGQT